MLKTKGSKIGFLLTLFVLCIFSGTVQTQETQEEIECWNCLIGNQTLFHDFTVPENWRDSYKPKIKSSSDTIAAGGSITLWVDSGTKSLPPYNWSVSETGYSISPGTTDTAPERVTLTCAEGT